MKYPCNMNTRNWKFVKDGLDDFRDGLPPPHDDIILEVDFFKEKLETHYDFLVFVLLLKNSQRKVLDLC